MSDKVKAAVFTLGCKVNQYESQTIVTKLTQMGLDAVDGLEKADIYIINTCSVTSGADKKSRQAVARVQRINKDAKIIIIGCSSQNDASHYLEKQGVVAVFGTSNKLEKIENAVKDILSGNITKEKQDSRQKKVFRLSPVFEENPVPTSSRTRAFVKIQDGCDNFCSYCRVPYLRGRSRSRSIDSIVSEISALEKNVKEIVLTGIDISSYGKKSNSSLTQLIQSIKSTARLRLGSLECSVIDKEFLQAVKDNNFCDHFHLSLQSGSDSVLRRMNRHYTTAEFLEKINLIKEFFSYASITTDVIAGFPQESQAEHDQTKEFLLKAEFSDLHVFPYSPRKGTKAFDLPQIDKKVREQRAAEITKIKHLLKDKFLSKNLGRTLEVYAEDVEDGFVVGFTSNYIKVYTNLKAGELKPLRLEKKYKEGVIGINE